MQFMIHDITEENIKEIVNLHVSAKQLGFVETVEESLAEAKIDKRYHPLGLYINETPVGFAMCGYFQNEGKAGRVWLDRFFIDERYQGKGYGKEFIRLLLERLFQKYKCAEIFLSVYEENENAIRMYQKFGFNFNGGFDTRGERIMVLKLNDK